MIFTRKSTVIAVLNGILVGWLCFKLAKLMDPLLRLNLSVWMSSGKPNDSVKKRANAFNQKHEVLRIQGFFSHPQNSNQFLQSHRDLLTAIDNVELQLFNPRIDLKLAQDMGVETENSVVLQWGACQKQYSSLQADLFVRFLISCLKPKKRFVYFSQNAPLDLKSEDGISQFVADLQSLEVAFDALTDLSLLQEDDILIVASQVADLQPDDAARIAQHLNKSGSALFLLDSLYPSLAFNQLLQPYHIQFADDLLFLAEDHWVTQLAGQNNVLLESEPNESKFLISEARSIALGENSKGVPLVYTEEDTLRLSRVASVADLELASEQQITTGRYLVGAMVHNEKSHIIVFGSSSLLKNLYFKRTRTLLNQIVYQFLYDLGFTSLLQTDNRHTTTTPTSMEK